MAEGLSREKMWWEDCGWRKCGGRKCGWRIVEGGNVVGGFWKEEMWWEDCGSLTSLDVMWHSRHYSLTSCDIPDIPVTSCGIPDIPVTS